jgi:2-polyprenyl-3-methyl-5-hydroxy-6-metoxy-1,4-benzoquinol methylase
MTVEGSHCLFCNSTSLHDYAFQEKALFSNTVWGYVRCHSCGLVQLHPLPGEKQLREMYGISYHETYYFLDEPYPISFYENLLNATSTQKILDFGCGDGSFLKTIKRENIVKTGVEVDPVLVSRLQEQYPEMNFFTTADFFKQNSVSFDVIHLGDVLEHSVAPQLLLQQLKNHLKNDGYLIVDGPLEANTNIAYACRRLAQKIKQTTGLYKVRHYTPYHITFSNNKNQLQLFKKLKFDTYFWHVYEAPWPYPDRLTKSLFGNCKYIIAKVSIALSRVLPLPWGNRFVYVGRKRLEISE